MKNSLKFYFLVFKLFLKGFSISEIQKVIEDYKHKTMMLEFRTNALLFGFDVDNYSDEEIIEMVNTAGKEIAKCGITGYEAGVALSQLQRSMIEFQPEFN